MRKIEIQNTFGLGSLRLCSTDGDTLVSDKVRLKIRANSLNYRDLLMVKGLYNPRQSLPLVPLSDGVGEIIEVGADAVGLELGTRVVGLFSQTWHDGPLTKAHQRATLGGPLDGCAQSHMDLPSAGVAGVPDYLTDEEASTLPCAALTAYSALFEHGAVAAGDTVLCLGTGGVSIFALQMAKAAGARVMITSGNDAKLAKARALGADEIVNYRTTPDWEKSAREWTDGVGVSHVVEVGGAGTLGKSIAAVKPSGDISLIGVLAEQEHPPNLLPAVMKQVRIQGIFVGHRRTFNEMCAFFELHRIRPVIDAVYESEDFAGAFSKLERADHMGKVVLRWR